ncbi:YfiR family protein [Psychromonas sp. KJ10-10]|uniref:YfiR family protein n=1 Tax=Psychromonas sp. KJ10-10 TaxID=3391823 RepID=UPI0039B50E4A
MKRNMTTFKKYFCTQLAILLVMIFTSCSVLSATPTISALKVAYLYNIAKFTLWPSDTWDSPTSPFYFCSYGDDDVISELQSLEDKTIAGHPIKLLKPNQENEFKQCHAIYIDTNKGTRYRYLLSLINQDTVLTITDDGAFFDYGGLINLIEKDQRLRFEVNIQQLANSQLKFSSKLLQLAILIDGEG